MVECSFRKIAFYLIFLSISFSDCLFADEPNVVFLSGARTGTHWTLYCLHHVTENYDVHYPELFWVDEDKEELERRESLPRKFHHVHFAYTLGKNLYNSSKDFLIVVVRNYKEYFLRHCYDAQEVYKISDASLCLKSDQIDNVFAKADILSYLFYNLYLYDKWPEERRHIVYYEDLMQDPEATLDSLLEFLGEDTSKLRDFMQTFDEHKAFALSRYHKERGSVTKGTDLEYHSKQISVDTLKSIDEHVKKNWGDVWEKYLSRYEYQATYQQ